jgi:ubiquinone biosynthesis protein Coq4
MKKIRAIRLAILIKLTHNLALPLLRRFRRTIPFSHTIERLAEFPDGSLGKDLAVFLEVRKLPLLPHYARHDIKHVLLGYDTTEEGEVCLQSFMLGNGRVSFPVLATVLYGIITMPEYWKKMRVAYRLGKKCTSFHGWNWNESVYQPTNHLRKLINGS